ncbi:WD repeat-containing protein 13-like [Ornithodoros turicata]
MAAVWQQVLALDARYNAYRSPHDPGFRTLYIRRRSQLLRDALKEERNVSFRRQYLRLRSLLLAQRCGLALDQASNRSNRSGGARSSSRMTIETSDSFEARLPTAGERSRRGSLSTRQKSVTEEGLVPTHAAEASRAIVGGTSISENYAFAGMHHIFDQHKDAVTSVKFANNEKFLLACCSLDGKLSICGLNPPSVLRVLEGHSNGITSFEWSQANDLLVSSSLDASVKLWDARTGLCVRTVPDSAGAPILSCVFQPGNNNMVVTGNTRGLVQVVNISTGIYLKGGSSQTTGRVLCMTFDPSGKLLWAGDDRGYIVSYLFDIPSGKLTKGKRLLVSENCPITCLSARQWASREARNPSVLANCATANVLALYSVQGWDGSLSLKRKFNIKHRMATMVRSSFCPIMSFRLGTCVVSGSEDQCVHIFDVERPRPLVNKLQGHSAAVLDVCFNYDESLLASSDALGMVILWKRSAV